MATYKKKLLDKNGNVILPYTRSELVFLQNATTLQAWIDSINTYNTVPSLSVTNFDTMSYSGIHFFRVSYTAGCTGNPGAYNFGYLIHAQLNSTNRLQIYLPHWQPAATDKPKYRIQFDGNWQGWYNFA